MAIECQLTSKQYVPNGAYMYPLHNAQYKENIIKIDHMCVCTEFPHVNKCLFSFYFASSKLLTFVSQHFPTTSNATLSYCDLIDVFSAITCISIHLLLIDFQSSRKEMCSYVTLQHKSQCA